MGGFKEMTDLPEAIYIVDPAKERIAIAEARKMGVPVIAIVDTNCNPDEVDLPIPANDDAIRAIKLITGKIASAVIEGQNLNQTIAADAEAEAVEAGEIAMDNEANS